MGRNSTGAGGRGITTLKRIAKFHGFKVQKLSPAQSVGGRYKYKVTGGPGGKDKMMAENQGVARRLIMRNVRDTAMRRYLRGDTKHVSTRTVRPGVR